VHYFSEHRSEIQPLYQRLGANSALNDRFEVMGQLWQSPQDFLEAANILYRAPADAADTKLPAASVDYHFSYTVLEHIPLESLRTLFAKQPEFWLTAQFVYIRLTQVIIFSTRTRP
jgi:hypothetical protein